MPVKDAFGEVRNMVIQVHDGYVYALLEGVQGKYSPQEISELRQVLAEAQAVAFMQGGSTFES